MEATYDRRTAKRTVLRRASKKESRSFGSAGANSGIVRDREEVTDAEAGQGAFSNGIGLGDERRASTPRDPTVPPSETAWSS